MLNRANIEKYILFFIVISILFSQWNIAIAQSLTGTKGLISIPIGYIPEHGEVFIGTNFIAKNYLAYGSGNYNAVVNYANIGYLPFLEIALRATRLMNHPEPHTIGDRMIIVRLCPVKESQYLPSVVLGAHDFIYTNPEKPTNNFNTLYISASKGLEIKPFIHRIEFHLGYGTDWIKARNHEFIGLFGGVSIIPRQFINLMAEYDAEKINLGARLIILNHINVIVCLLNFDTFSFGLSYRFRI